MSALPLRSVPHMRAAPAAAEPRPRTMVSFVGSVSQKSRRLAARVSSAWLPRLVWWLGCSGRPGFVGMALLGATAVFFFSTHLPLSSELLRLRGELAQARSRDGAAAPHAPSVSARGLRNLPTRTEMPRVLGVLFEQAEGAHLAIDTAKYEIGTTKAGALVRYRLSFPVEGTYSNVRRFIDSSLIALPALAIDDLTIARKAIGDPTVAAQLRVTIFTRSSP